MSTASQSSRPSSAHQPSSQRPRPPSPNPVLVARDAQWYFTEEDLKRTPSIEDGMTLQDETERRTKGINFIIQVGIMLKIPQVTLSSASIFFHRFLMRRSMVDKPGQKALHHYQVAATALFLATKVEENCRKMRDIVVACCRVAQKNPNIIIDEQSKDYWRWRDTILYNEDVVLETLCFDLSYDSPHKLYFEMLKYYQLQHNKPLRNAGWAFVNDSALTMMGLVCSPRVIAATGLYMAAAKNGVSIPDAEDGMPWYEWHWVSMDEIRRAINMLGDLYLAGPLKDGSVGGGDSVRRDGDVSSNGGGTSERIRSPEDEQGDGKNGPKADEEEGEVEDTTASPTKDGDVGIQAKIDGIVANAQQNGVKRKKDSQHLANRAKADEAPNQSRTKRARTEEMEDANTAAPQPPKPAAKSNAAATKPKPDGAAAKEDDEVSEEGELEE